MDTQGPPRGRQKAGGMDADEITAWLRDEIEQGTWKAGDQLPRNADLIEETGASNTTVSKAVANLKSEGLLVGRKGQRPRVTDTRVVDYRVTDPTRPTWLVESRPHDMWTTLATARDASIDLTVQRVTASELVTKRLGVEPSAEVIMRRVVQSIAGRVIAIEATYYRLDLALELGLDSPEDIAEGTTRRVGKSRHRDTGWLTETLVRPATTEEQKLFAVPTGASLIEIVTTAANGHAANYVAVRVIHPAGVRIVHELGDDSGLATIRRNRGDK